ncbi:MULTISPECIES: hypothetical protein [unclassified Chryseobacterium]|uniref:hypothetical protein n=1 Tax=unclassified Chryseobacterium TaxID=2593645 RepID=UPI002853560E|nr:hypothetical protein [Chryseobacterium sp. CFS7]MDR4892301.1 hypothetical protein [Chryseobacterium sp. CFS7]
MKDIESVLLDNSFVMRLLKSDDEFHEQTVEYYRYFIEKNIVMYLSTIVISEYAVADDPQNLLMLKSFQILEFDYGDAKVAGEYYTFLKDIQDTRENIERKVIINDLKLLGQIKNREIDAFISKDRKCYNKMILPLQTHMDLKVKFIDLSIPLRDYLGTLF